MSIQAGRTIKIIVVDDEPISADDMSDVIRDEFGKSMNVDVRTAYNAKSVIKMVEESPCDILLSDRYTNAWYDRAANGKHTERTVSRYASSVSDRL